jgi:large subunit ribosomal protein L25
MLEGIIRESIGKKATKAYRRDGYLIANIYGAGLENINAAFKMGDFLRAVKRKTSVAFDVKVGDKELKVVVQDYQSHPVKDTLLHVDLIVAQAEKVQKYFIPVKTVGTPIGLKNKSVLMVAQKRIPVKSTIENLPDFIEINVEPLDSGDSVLIRDLPQTDKYEILLADRIAILSMIKAK